MYQTIKKTTAQASPDTQDGHGKAAHDCWKTYWRFRLVPEVSGANFELYESEWTLSLCQRWINRCSKLEQLTRSVLSRYVRYFMILMILLSRTWVQWRMLLKAYVNNDTAPFSRLFFTYKEARKCLSCVTEFLFSFCFVSNGRKLLLTIAWPASDNQKKLMLIIARLCDHPLLLLLGEQQEETSAYNRSTVW